MRAHAKTRDEESVGVLRQQRAERDVHLERLPRVRRLDEELVGDGLSVRVEVGARERDYVWVGALVHDVLRRNVVDSVQAAALAAVDVLALVPDIRAKVLARAEREVAEILRISVVDERVVRVLVARAEDLRRGARALEREFGRVDELRLLARERGEIGVARGVDGCERADESARSVLERHLDRHESITLLANASDERAEPDLRAGLARLRAHPLGLALSVNRAEVVHSLVELLREADGESVAVEPDESVGHCSAHARKVLRDDRLRAGPCGRDSSWRAARARACDKDVALGDDRQVRTIMPWLNHWHLCRLRALRGHRALGASEPLLCGSVIRVGAEDYGIR